jgi:eukaryotic-like serine/threonine-protein kinase
MKKKLNIIKLSGIIVATIAVVASLAYFIYSFIYMNGDIKKVVTSFIIFLIAVVGLVSIFVKKDIDRTIVNTSTLLLVILLIVFSYVSFDNNIIGNKNIVLDFNNKTVDEVLKWAGENDITVEQKYEYSDDVPEFGIISQNYAYGTELDTIDTLIITISLGPNYDKQVIIPSYVGTNIDDALISLKEYFLNNIEVVFEINGNFEKDIIIDQSIKGQMRRNDLLTLRVALDSALTDISAIDLKGLPLFDAELWLNRNQIRYELKYEFSDTVLRNNVIGQSIKEDTTITVSTDKMTLIVSKGKAVIVPDLTKMTIEDITKWIIDNKLKIEYKDQYDAEIELGKVISANYKINDEIEEGTTIELVVSKGI